MKAGVDARTFAESLVATLPVGREGLYNPWREICLEDAASNGPEDKLARLAAHLDCEPTIILCAEAAAMPGETQRYDLYERAAVARWDDTARHDASAKANEAAPSLL